MDIRSLNNYHPYGSLIDAESWSGSSYNFGDNGMLKEGIKTIMKLNRY